MRQLVPVLLGLVILPAVAAAQGPCGCGGGTASGERYYVMLFGGQGDLFRPRTAHTWATFIRTSASPAGEQVAAVDTISWLPATLNIRPWAAHAETGVNLTLEQTLAFIDTTRRTRIAVWGPLEITADLYQKALAQKALLESGAIRYHSLGLFGRKADVMHCIDGVTRIDPRWEKAADPSLWFGEAGTGQATRAAARTGLILNPYVTHAWLTPLVTADGHTLKQRELGSLRAK